MAVRFKMTAKQDLCHGKIKKGDTLVCIMNGGGSKPTGAEMAEAIANFVGETNPSRLKNAGQYYGLYAQYAQWNLERMR